MGGLRQTRASRVCAGRHAFAAAAGEQKGGGVLAGARACTCMCVRARGRYECRNERFRTKSFLQRANESAGVSIVECREALSVGEEGDVASGGAAQHPLSICVCAGGLRPPSGWSSCCVFFLRPRARSARSSVRGRDGGGGRRPRGGGLADRQGADVLQEGAHDACAGGKEGGG